jgi:hypothetical protein
MMNKFKFDCPTAEVPVTVTRQTLKYSAIGGSATLIQHDYGCSHEDNCEHRVTAACRVRELNG